MVAISIIKNKKYNDLLYKVQKEEVSDLIDNYSNEESFLFEEKFLEKTRLDVDIDSINKNLVVDKKFDFKPE